MFIAMDLDGTLLHSDKSISDRTLKTLQACRIQGHIVALATGRPKVLQGVTYANCPAPFWDGAVYNNGAQIFAQGACLADFCIPPSIWHGFVQNLSKRGEPFLFAANPTDGSVLCNFNLQEKMPHYHHYRLLQNQDFLRPMAKVFMFTTPYWTSETIASCLPDCCQMKCLDGGKLINIYRKDVGKAQGVAHLAAHFGFTMNDIFAFGDDVNDEDMLHMAGTGIAMGNACRQVRDAISIRTLSNDEDGIADYLEKHLLR